MRRLAKARGLHISASRINPPWGGGERGRIITNITKDFDIKRIEKNTDGEDVTVTVKVKVTDMSLAELYIAEIKVWTSSDISSPENLWATMPLTNNRRKLKGKGRKSLILQRNSEWNKQRLR